MLSPTSSGGAFVRTNEAKTHFEDRDTGLSYIHFGYRAKQANHCVGIVNTGALGLLAWFVSVVMKSIRVKTRLDIMSEFSIQNQ